MSPKPAKKTPRPVVQLHVQLPMDLHRRAKSKAVLTGQTWDEVVAQAVLAWIKQPISGV